MYRLLLVVMCMVWSVDISADEWHAKEIQCLAKNVYFEARGESLTGKIAVANVTLNRVRSNKFPDSVCAVITQAKTYKNWKGNVVPRRNQCQFSWFCDGMSDKVPTYDKEVWEVSIYLAQRIFNGKYFDNTFGATHYHAHYVSPKWAKKFRHTTTIGDHIFYRYD